MLNNLDVIYIFDAYPLVSIDLDCGYGYDAIRKVYE